jgi:hypothetical protein
VTRGRSADTRTRSVNAFQHVAKLFAAMLLMHGWAPSDAEEKILIENLPAGIETQAALTFAREALEYREWTIVRQGAEFVEAKISRSAIDAKIRVRRNGNQLVYEDSARGKPKVDHTGRLTPSITEAPSRWIYYLRSDITEKLQQYTTESASATPAASPQPPVKDNVAGAARAPRRATSVQRMQELKEMLDRGLISADEYARKREQILNEL